MVRGEGGGTAQAASRPYRCEASVAGAEPELKGTSVPRAHYSLIWEIKRGIHFPEYVARIIFNSFS